MAPSEKDHADPTPQPAQLAEPSPADDDKPSRILVALPSWVGDLVLATPALKAIRTRFPEAHISYLLRPHLADILSGCPWMDEFIPWPSRSRRKRPAGQPGFIGLARRQRTLGYDLAILLANSFRAALFARLAGATRRVGYDRDLRGWLLTDRLLPERRGREFVPVPMIDYYNAIAEHLGCTDVARRLELATSEDDEAETQRALRDAGVREDQPVVVLNPGASFGPAKCWLPERFAEVADRLVDRHEAAVFITCGPNEVDIARSVAGHMRHPANVLADPIMKLGPSKALIRRAALLITNDTGPRHFANAFGTPVVTIFGPTDPVWTLTDSPTERSVMISVDCGPCMKRECPLDHRCMTGITGDMVLEKAEELIRKKSASPAA